MYKFIMKFFNFLRQTIHFFKIIIMFCIFLFFIFWAQNLTGGDWKFLNFIEPLFNNLLRISENINNGCFEIQYTEFEYKYLIVFAIFVLFYVFLNVLTIIVNKIDEIYNDSVRLTKKIQEDALNKTLQNNITKSEKKIKQYKIYISTSIKKNFIGPNFNVNIEEQNKVMNKFIIEKTNIKPIAYKDGFLYSYFDFDSIDKVLDIFMRVKNAKTPLDYYICVQAFGENIVKEMTELDKLISLKITNRLIMMADTAFRYSFNNEKAFKTCQIGVFQKEENMTFEVHEFYLQ